MSRFGPGARLAGVKALAGAVAEASSGTGPSLSLWLGAPPRLGKAVAAGEYHGVSAKQLGLLTAALPTWLRPSTLLPEALLGAFGLVDDAVVIA